MYCLITEIISVNPILRTINYWNRKVGKAGLAPRGKKAVKLLRTLRAQGKGERRESVKSNFPNASVNMVT